MEIETLNAMNEGMYLNLLTMLEVIVLINIVLVMVGFAIYLAGIAWLCFAETRRPAPRQMKIGPPVQYRARERAAVFTSRALQEPPLAHARGTVPTLRQVIGVRQ